MIFFGISQSGVRGVLSNNLNNVAVQDPNVMSDALKIIPNTLVKLY